MIPPTRVHRCLLSGYNTRVFASATSFQRSHPALDQRSNGIRATALVISNSPSRRYTSKSHTRPPSSAQPGPSTIPSASSTSTDDVNPAPSTRPAELVFPPPLQPSAGLRDKLGRYLAVGKTYLTFYKTGVKNVYFNYRTSLPLRRSLGLPAYLPVSPPPAPNSQKATAFRTAIKSHKVSRSSFQLVRRAAYDMRRLIPFAFTLIICGEFTPLIVLALGNVITPYTCRIPKQIEKNRAKRVEVKRDALSAHQAAATGSLTPLAVGSEQELDILANCYGDLGWAHTASAEEILRACAVFGLSKSHARHPLLASVIYRPRLQRYAEYLSLDDQLIREGGGVKTMEASEVRMAVGERGGVDVGDGKDGWELERTQRRWLERWLERRNQ